MMIKPQNPRSMEYDEEILEQICLIWWWEGIISTNWLIQAPHTSYGQNPNFKRWIGEMWFTSKHLQFSIFWWTSETIEMYWGMRNPCSLIYPKSEGMERFWHWLSTQPSFYSLYNNMRNQDTLILSKCMNVYDKT